MRGPLPKLAPLSLLRTRVSFEVLPEVHAEWTTFAAEWDMTLSAMLVEAMACYIETTQAMDAKDRYWQRQCDEQEEEVA